MKKIALMVLLSVFMASPVFAQEKKTVVIATDALWAPMEFTNEKKEVVGFAVDMMEAAAKEGGYNLKLIVTPWDGIFGGLMRKKYDAICSSVTITEGRKKVMAFSIPYYIVSQAVIVPTDATVKTLEDLVGKKVGVQVSTTSVFVIENIPGVESQTFDEVSMAVDDLAFGRLDAVVCDYPVAAQLISDSGKYKGKFKIALVLDNPGEQEAYGVAVRKQDKETLELINKGLEAVKAKGIEKELLKKWKLDAAPAVAAPAAAAPAAAAPAAAAAAAAPAAPAAAAPAAAAAAPAAAAPAVAAAPAASCTCCCQRQCK